MKDKEAHAWLSQSIHPEHNRVRHARHHRRHVNLDLVRAVAELTRNRRQKNTTCQKNVRISLLLEFALTGLVSIKALPKAVK